MRGDTVASNKVLNDQWQKESDAHTLADAELIKSDPKRHAGAKQAATKLAAERKQTADSLTKVAKQTVKSTPKPSGKKK